MVAVKHYNYMYLMFQNKQGRIDKDKIKSVLVSSVGQLIKSKKSPDEIFGDLYFDVQQNHVYKDGKLFADLVPRHRVKQIQQEYALLKDDPKFDLHDFISRHFYNNNLQKSIYKTNLNMTPRQHIDELWGVLERKQRRNQGSLIALPYAYVVPGGRFSEQFYWDSYFIMLGLAADNHWDKVEGMIKNVAYMIRKFGFVPTANRTYFLSRSQPPFFSQMVKLLASHKGNKVLLEYLPYMVMEYNFWMKGRNKLSKSEYKANARVVEMPNGTMLNRYYDKQSTPRAESLNEDLKTVGDAPDYQSDRMYLHLRAGAESGWDFSSRWFDDVQDIKTIRTADIVPIDLNCLLYQLEITIAEAYDYIKQPIFARKFKLLANSRAKALNDYCWDESTGFFNDYYFHDGQQTGRLTLASVFPLYSKIATDHQANLIAMRLERDFLRQGGLVTTLVETGQQWDSPNGWAPLQWIAIEGLRNYGYNELANEIKRRWIKTNLDNLNEKHKLVEKYNVINPIQPGSGGEYPLQDGFGWTNGVLAALLSEVGGNRLSN